jgi:predicted metal-dependent HD superfamily phosphohydrolase
MAPIASSPHADLIASFLRALHRPAPSDAAPSDAAPSDAAPSDAAPSDAATAAAELIDRWTEPHRRYHTVDHLRATLSAVSALLAAPDAPTVPDRGAIDLAAWFHDAVHTGSAGTDEEQSARLAESRLGSLGQLPARIAEVARLVRLTVRHDPAPDDVAGAVLCDADLAVLGSAPQVYASYAGAVRAEYAHVPEEAFRAGRAEVLDGLLAAVPLYRTIPGRRMFSERARRNLAAERDRLRADVTRS